MCPGASTCCWTGPPPLVPRGCGSRERSEVGAAQSSEGSAAPDLLIPTHLVSLGACGSSKALQQRRLSIRGVSGNTEVTCTESCARPLLPGPAPWVCGSVDSGYSTGTGCPCWDSHLPGHPRHLGGPAGLAHRGLPYCPSGPTDRDPACQHPQGSPPPPGCPPGPTGCKSCLQPHPPGSPGCQEPQEGPVGPKLPERQKKGSRVGWSSHGGQTRELVPSTLASRWDKSGEFLRGQRGPGTHAPAGPGARPPRATQALWWCH